MTRSGLLAGLLLAAILGSVCEVIILLPVHLALPVLFGTPGASSRSTSSSCRLQTVLSSAISKGEVALAPLLPPAYACAGAELAACCSLCVITSAVESQLDGFLGWCAGQGTPGAQRALPRAP